MRGSVWQNILRANHTWKLAHCRYNVMAKYIANRINVWTVSLASTAKGLFVCIQKERVVWSSHNTLTSYAKELLRLFHYVNHLFMLPESWNGLTLGRSYTQRLPTVPNGPPRVNNQSEKSRRQYSSDLSTCGFISSQQLSLREICMRLHQIWELAGEGTGRIRDIYSLLTRFLLKQEGIPRCCIPYLIAS